MSLVCCAIFLVLSACAVVFAGQAWARVIVYGGCALTGFAGLLSALSYLAGTTPGGEWIFPLGLPWIGAHFAVDSLSAFFLAIVNGGAVLASLYAIGYGRHESAPWRVLPFYPAFLAGMTLVVLAADAFTFLLSWEFMSLASWALVMAYHRVRDNAQAGYVYIVMASFGTFALLLAFGMLAGPDGSYAFSSMREGIRAPWQDAMILLFVLLGAGSKAGLVPLHVWLPLAHPAAPSHVSALMSGVMTKVAVYAFVRVVFDLLGGTGWEAALVILVLGGASAVLGVLQALMHTDIKKILACSTVENIGIVFIGLGLSLAFQSGHMPAMAALALSAALFHVFNHALFKSLLFFGAGAVVHATGARDLDKMGGLIHRMPVTAVCLLIGCAAISSLPPLNGFASEWVLLQAILQSPALPEWGLKVSIPAVGCLLALSAALAGACFVRLFGVAFLGRPRTPQAAQAHEVDRFSLGAMAFLALACILAGVMPGLILEGIHGTVQDLIAGGPAPQGRWLSLVPVSEDRSTYSGVLVFVFVLVASGVTALLARRVASSALRRGPAWDCGFPGNSPLFQYGAGSFVQPIRRVFGARILHARESVEMPDPGDLRPASFRVDLRDPAWEGIFLPISRGVRGVAERCNIAQFLTIRKYLGLVFVFLVFLLGVLALWT
ncbi:MAG: hydrogenase 4 subunit B [Rhodospirillales bacterium]|nr:hydrogenase 4 subunit B [Rhodospirillales bacterium]